MPVAHHLQRRGAREAAAEKPILTACHTLLTPDMASPADCDGVGVGGIPIAASSSSLTPSMLAIGLRASPSQQFDQQPPLFSSALSALSASSKSLAAPPPLSDVFGMALPTLPRSVAATCDRDGEEDLFSLFPQSMTVAASTMAPSMVGATKGLSDAPSTVIRAAAGKDSCGNARDGNSDDEDDEVELLLPVTAIAAAPTASADQPASSASFTGMVFSASSPSDVLTLPFALTAPDGAIAGSGSRRCVLVVTEDTAANSVISMRGGGNAAKRMGRVSYHFSLAPTFGGSEDDEGDTDGDAEEACSDGEGGAGLRLGTEREGGSAEGAAHLINNTAQSVGRRRTEPPSLSSVDRLRLGDADGDGEPLGAAHETDSFTASRNGAGGQGGKKKKKRARSPQLKSADHFSLKNANKANGDQNAAFAHTTLTTRVVRAALCPFSDASQLAAGGPVARRLCEASPLAMALGVAADKAMGSIVRRIASFSSFSRPTCMPAPSSLMGTPVHKAQQAFLSPSVYVSYGASPAVGPRVSSSLSPCVVASFKSPRHHVGMGAMAEDDNAVVGTPLRQQRRSASPIGLAAAAAAEAAAALSFFTQPSSSSITASAPPPPLSFFTDVDMFVYCLVAALSSAVTDEEICGLLLLLPPSRCGAVRTALGRCHCTIVTSSSSAVASSAGLSHSPSATKTETTARFGIFQQFASFLNVMRFDLIQKEHIVAPWPPSNHSSSSSHFVAVAGTEAAGSLRRLLSSVRSLLVTGAYDLLSLKSPQTADAVAACLQRRLLRNAEGPLLTNNNNNGGPPKGVKPQQQQQHQSQLLAAFTSAFATPALVPIAQLLASRCPQLRVSATFAVNKHLRQTIDAAVALAMPLEAEVGPVLLPAAEVVAPIALRLLWGHPSALFAVSSVSEAEMVALGREVTTRVASEGASFYPSPIASSAHHHCGDARRLALPPLAAAQAMAFVATVVLWLAADPYTISSAVATRRVALTLRPLMACVAALSFNSSNNRRKTNKSAVGAATAETDADAFALLVAQLEAILCSNTTGGGADCGGTIVGGGGTRAVAFEQLLPSGGACHSPFLNANGASSTSSPPFAAVAAALATVRAELRLPSAADLLQRYAAVGAPLEDALCVATDRTRNATVCGWPCAPKQWTFAYNPTPTARRHQSRSANGTPCASRDGGRLLPKQEGHGHGSAGGGLGSSPSVQCRLSHGAMAPPPLPSADLGSAPLIPSYLRRLTSGLPADGPPVFG